MISLEKINLDKTYKVKDIHSTPSMKRRFLDIGIIPGATIKKVLTNPFGGIHAYFIMGTTIAIRDSDVKGIKVCYEEV